MGITKNLTVNTNTLFVDSNNGNVGIGTNNPSDTLHVVGNITVEGAIRTVSGDNVVIPLSGTSGVVYTFPMVANEMYAVHVSAKQNPATASSFLVMVESSTQISFRRTAGGSSNLNIDSLTGTMKIINENGCGGTCSPYNYIWSVTRLN